MFWFNRKKRFKPKKPSGHEGIGCEGRIAFSNAERTWEETFNLLDILEILLKENGYAVKQKDGWLKTDYDFYLRPEIVEFQPLEPSGIRTVTTISIAHRYYCPDGIFEYQHATGDDSRESLASGIFSWIEFDFPAILGIANNDQKICNVMEMKFPEQNGRIRRAVLGPPSHVASNDIVYDEDHPFCPCCLLTKSYEAFRQFMEGDGCYAIRLLVARSEDGDVSADCRVNGIDYEAGKEQLVEYGEKWPDRGFEMRKQYVVIYTKDALVDD